MLDTTTICIVAIICLTLIELSKNGIEKSKADKEKFIAEKAAHEAETEAIRTERAKCPGPRT
ncbi:hypothetical protein [Lacrimispora sp.]|uniref:hypothetical protein n=1 Tax=Lacrimispora sp. TaxID=2719234 RepID=UPI00285C846A|nr:hypothetical protein [Lacrimispora sp.]MDR7814525.1 hypothetical protein [Lacrimispora sp.]